jgi:predicted unusual protein kinase regulating ubiquinone biosynthesis (AarF/ABC1/UbiB family)
MVHQLMTVSRVHRLRLPAALLSLMRMLAILDGVLRGLDPARDVVRDLRGELARAWLRQLARGAIGRARRGTLAGAQSLRALVAAARDGIVVGAASTGAARRLAAVAIRALRWPSLSAAAVFTAQRVADTARCAARRAGHSGRRAARWLAQTASRHARRVRALPRGLL